MVDVVLMWKPVLVGLFIGGDMYGQTVILHTLPLNYVVIM